MATPGQGGPLHGCRRPREAGDLAQQRQHALWRQIRIGGDDVPDVSAAVHKNAPSGVLRQVIALAVGGNGLHVAEIDGVTGSVEYGDRAAID